MRTLPHTKSCFVCGESNHAGLKLRFHTDGTRVSTKCVAAAHHVGFKTTVHGGIVATLLDEVMAWVCAVRAGRFAFCAELNVRFSHPVRPGIEINVEGELVANRRDKLYETKATVRDMEGRVLASATGKYLPIPHRDALDFMEDVVGELSPLLKPPG
jgi:uncharacterized protein (TIGR00369 family)